MKRKSFLSMGVFGVLFFFLALPALSAERIALQPGAELRNATGEVLIQDVGAGQKEVVINAQNLRPGEVYTVWLVTERLLGRMDMAGLGTAPYDFHTDPQGNGRYSGTISATDLDRWEFIRIALHPDRNPRNMDNITIDLEAELK
jgi:hypothetical protein